MAVATRPSEVQNLERKKEAFRLHLVGLSTRDIEARWSVEGGNPMFNSVKKDTIAKDIREMAAGYAEETDALVRLTREKRLKQVGEVIDGLHEDTRNPRGDRFKWKAYMDALAYEAKLLGLEQPLQVDVKTENTFITAVQAARNEAGESNGKAPPAAVPPELIPAVTAKK